jgi:pimeloyl-ACP methyl ester carboxylesterase
MSDIRLPQGTIRYTEAGAGEPLLFVHGFGANGRHWRKVVPHLAKDYRCIAPDWPLSSHEVPMRADADLSPPAIAQLISDFMDALELERLTLIGNDTGTAFAQLVAVDHSDRVDRLVLLSGDVYECFPPAVARPVQMVSRIPGGLRMVAHALVRFRPLQRTPFTYGSLSKTPHPQDVIESYLGPARREAGVRRDAKKVLLSVHKRYTLDAAERLRKFDKPTLVVWGAEDKVFPLEKGRRLAQEMPNARFEVVADSYGFLSEDQPERLAELIAAFVREPVPAEGQYNARPATRWQA